VPEITSPVDPGLLHALQSRKEALERERARIERELKRIEKKFRGLTGALIE